MTQTIDKFLELQGIEQVIVIDDEIPQAMSDECLAAMVGLNSEDAAELLGQATPADRDAAADIVNDLESTEVGRLVRRLMQGGHILIQPDFVAPLVNHDACLFFDGTTWGEFFTEEKNNDVRRLFVIDRRQGTLDGNVIAKQAHTMVNCAGILYLSGEFDDCHSMTALLEEIRKDELETLNVYPFRRQDAVAGDNQEDSVLAGFQLAVAGPLIFNLIEPLENAFSKVSSEAFQAFRGQLFLLSCHRLLSHSVPEGIWPPSAYASYVSNRVQDNIVAELSKDEDLVARVKEMVTQSWTAGDSVARLLQIVHSDTAADDFTFRDPNPDRLPLAPGDVFEVTAANGTKEYVLLAQECDLAIRPNGCRGAVTTAILAPIADTSAGESESKAPFPPQHAASAERSVEFAKAITVPISVLDLCVYNTEGQCSADVNENEAEHWHPSLEEHWPAVQKPLRKAVNRYKPMAKKLKDATDISDGMKTDIAGLMRYPIDLAAVIPFEIDGTTATYGLRRVRRLEASHAVMLLQRLSWYQARPAINAPLFTGMEQPAV